MHASPSYDLWWYFFYWRVEGQFYQVDGALRRANQFLAKTLAYQRVEMCNRIVSLQYTFFGLVPTHASPEPAVSWMTHLD